MPPQPLTFDTVRELARTLPGVEESTSYGSPACKFDGRLLAEDPETYYLPDPYKSYPVVLVRLTRISR